MKNILSSSENKIVKFLALNGPSNRWEIHNGTGIKYQTVYSAIKRLLEKRLFIGIFDVEKARTDLDKPLYFATVVGKLVVITTLENDDDDLDLIATSEQSGRPRFLIFEEWEHICQNKLARSYVLSIIRTALLDILRTWRFDELDELQIQKEYANEVSVIMIGYNLIEKILWDGYPEGNVESLRDYGLTHDSDIFQFFMGNTQIREQMKRNLLVMEAKALGKITMIGKLKRKYGIE